MKQKSVICAIVKNEQQFIREWVEHYSKIGFERLYIYEDYGSDSHEEQLHDYIESGKVILNNLEETKFIPVLENTMRIQYALYKKFLEMCKNKEIDADWIGFFDVDEFMMFEDGWNLERLEEEFSDCGGVLLSWKIYGANGHLKRPKGNVVDNYTSHLPENSRIDGRYKWHVKSLVNVKKCSGINSIHTFNECQATDRKTNEILSFEKAWLNHYFTKSWEDYCDRMEKRGNMSNNNRCYDKFFEVSPEMREIEKYLIEERRYNTSLSDTMYISHKHKIIKGGNKDHLIELRKKFLNY